MRGIAEIEKAALIVAAGVIDLNRREEGVFDFVLVAAGRREIREQVACLSGHIGAILLCTRVSREIAKLRRRNGIRTRGILRAW